MSFVVQHCDQFQQERKVVVGHDQIGMFLHSNLLKYHKTAYCECTKLIIPQNERRRNNFEKNRTNFNLPIDSHRFDDGITLCYGPHFIGTSFYTSTGLSDKSGCIDGSLAAWMATWYGYVFDLFASWVCWTSGIFRIFRRCGRFAWSYGRLFDRFCFSCCNTKGILNYVF